MSSNSSLEHINWISKTRIPKCREEPQRTQAHHPRWKKAVKEIYFCRANKYEETSGAIKAADFLQRPKGSKSQVLAVSDGEDAAQACVSIAIMDPS